MTQFSALFLSLYLPTSSSRIVNKFKDSIACLGDLLYYGGVEWLNISDFLGKIKKGLELHAMCFVFKSAVVFLCKERLRQKKKIMVSQQNDNKECFHINSCSIFLIYSGRLEQERTK